MQIAILSDSHDQLENLEKAINYLNEINVEEMIFCGDFCSPVPVKHHFSRFKGQIHSVFGNTEDRHLITQLSLTEVQSLKMYGEYADIKVSGLKVFITHYPAYAEAVFKNNNYDLVCYGHTHTARTVSTENSLLINPGEIAGFFEEPRFAILNTKTREVKTIFIKDI